MTWLTWRQLRLQSTVVAAAALALTVTLAITARGLSGAYDADLQTFIDQLQFKHLDRLLYLAGLVAVHSVAPIVAAFWGAPLIARELEAGTHRLVWNQSVSRHRWLAMKLLVTGALAAAVVGPLTLAVSWWSRPIDRAIGKGFGSGTFSLPRMDPVVFGARGIVAFGYVVFGLAFGVTVGLLVRRSIAAVALTLVVVAAAELLVPHFVREHLATPVTSNVVISTDNLDGIAVAGGPDGERGGAARIDVRAGAPGDWGLANETVDASGRVLSTLPTWFADCVASKIGPPAGDVATTKVRTRGRDVIQPCFARLTAEGYRQHVTYQPARNFWSLQLHETAFLVGLAGLLLGFCFWRLCRDVS